MSPKSVRPACRRAFTPAFTLVELLVVIGIIAILIALVVTVIPKIRTAAYGASTSAELSAISSALQQYYGDFKAYPGPLPNNQVGSAFDPNGVPSATSQYPLAGGYPLTGMTVSQTTHISGTQNMTLGLLGGLELSFNSTGGVSAFIYNPLDIFPDGTHPGPIGAASLNASNPRRQQSYLQVKQSYISTPINGHSFADAAGRSPTDSPIPVFIDQFPNGMPILYIRTNVAGAAICGIRNTDDNGKVLQDNSQAVGGAGYTVLETPQYDLCQVFDYTKSSIGVTTNSPHDHHGLQGVGNFLVDTIDSNGPSGSSTVNGYSPGGENGKNGCAYLRDPNFKVDTTNSSGSNNYDPQASNTHAGVAREKNGYILISAGKDRVYGTSDDNIFPGTLLAPQ